MSKTIAVGGTQNDGFVGDIITSALSEAQFQAQRNSTWVLMDGRAVGGSKYSVITGNASIPDARGMFLRGKNNGRVDGLQNPDGDLAIGAYQADAFASHTHSYTSQTGVAERSDGTVSPATNVGSITGATGGNETRSKNITVNYFIKIN